MKLVWWIAWQSLISKPARAGSSVLGVAIGLATVLAVTVIDHNTILSEQVRRDNRVGSPDVEIQPLAAAPSQSSRESNYREVRQELLSDPGIAEVSPFFLGEGELRVGSAGRLGLSQVTVCGLEPGSGPSFQAYSIQEGSDLSTELLANVVVSAPLAKRLGLQVGDSIELAPKALKVTRCLDGRLVQERQEVERESIPFVISGIASAQNLGRRLSVIVPYERGTKLFEGRHLTTIYWGQLREGSVLQDVKRRLGDAYLIEAPKRALIGERMDQRAFRKGIRLSALLSLILGLFVIYNAFSMSLGEKIRDIGLLRAMGMSRGEIRGAFILEASAIALMGVILGGLVAAGIVLFMVMKGITTLGYGKPLQILELPWMELFGLAGLGFFVAILGVVAPLMKSRRLSVVESIRLGQAAFAHHPGKGTFLVFFTVSMALIPLVVWITTPPLGDRQTHIMTLIVIGGLGLSLALAFVGVHRGVSQFLSRAGMKLLTTVMGWVFGPTRCQIPHFLAQSAASASSTRIKASMTGFMLVFSGILMIGGVLQSLQDETKRFSDRAVDGRVFIRIQNGAKGVKKAVTEVPGVEKVYPLGAMVHSPFIIRGIDPSVLDSSLWESDQERLEFEEGGVFIVSPFLAQNFGYEVGSSVAVPTYRGRREFQVQKLSDEFGYFPDDRNYALMALEPFESLFCVSAKGSLEFVAALARDRDSEAMAASIERALNQAQIPLQYVRSDRQIRQIYAEDRARDFLIFDVILWLTAILAGVGLLGSLTISVLERERELSWLRAAGLSRFELTVLLLLESLSIGLGGGLLALVVGGGLSYLAIDAMSVVSGLETEFRLSAGGVAFVLFCPAALALIASLYPIRRATKMTGSGLRLC